MHASSILISLALLAVSADAFSLSPRAATRAASRLLRGRRGGRGVVVTTPQMAADGDGGARNAAFVFIKPHAVTDPTKELVKAALLAKGLVIVSEGSISSEEIDAKQLIDQHYYAIASKATMMKPAELNVPADKFEAAFGLSWEDALASGEVYNAMDACGVLGLDAAALEAANVAASKAGKLVKFGGGFYCGLLEVEGKSPIYVFNAFFMSMRSKFTRPGGAIYYYNVEWDPAALAWADFRGELLGPTDPAAAPASSIRGTILAQYKDLGLDSEPNTGDNGVHASASPFEALAERMNWVGAELETDPFGRALLAAGVPAETIRAWTVDPVVAYQDGSKGSIFDALEDMDVAPCLEKCVQLAALGGGAPAAAAGGGADDDRGTASRASLDERRAARAAAKAAAAASQ